MPVLVASIHAAGVGLTLTAASECWFVECDWTPLIVSEAQDRIHRRGASRPVTITTLVAPGTFDEQIQQTVARKAKVLKQSMSGDDQHVASVTRSDRIEPGAGILSPWCRHEPSVWRRSGQHAPIAPLTAPANHPSFSQRLSDIE